MNKHKILGRFIFYIKKLPEYQSFFFLIHFWFDNDTLLVDSPNNKVLVDESSTTKRGHDCLSVSQNFGTHLI